MKTAFVTGGTGFLGRHLVEQLTADGWQVTVLARESSRVSVLEDTGATVVFGDILDPDRLHDVMPERVDGVFHLAGDTSQWSRHRARQYRINVDGVRHVAQTALQKKARRFVHTSSIAAFGLHEGVITEDTVSNAQTLGSPYMKTKRLGELEVLAAVSRGLDAVILNPPHIMGRYDTRNWVQLFRMVADGSLPGIPPGRGSFSHAPEVARAHIAAWERGRTGKRYLLGGADASFLELVQCIADTLKVKVRRRVTPAWVLQVLARFQTLTSRFTGKEPDLTPEKVQLVSESITCDCSRAVRELGYRPVPLVDMVRDTVDWMRQADMLPASSSR